MGLHVPAQRNPWRFECGSLPARCEGWSAGMSPPGEPLQSCPHSPSEVPAAATMWWPGWLLGDIPGPGFQELQEEHDLLLAIHWTTGRASAFIFPFCLFILSSFSCLFHSSFSFPLSGSGTRTSNRAFRSLRLASLRASWFFSKFPAQKFSWGNSSQAGSLSFTQSSPNTSTWTLGLKAGPWAWPWPGAWWHRRSKK